MILIGQYDSPFVRRVGIALTLYGIDFVQNPLSVFGDAEAVREINPLMRVPTLVLDDGTALADSHMMLDHIDSLVPEDQAMFPRTEPARHRALRVAALACGMGEKAVSLFYEKRMHREVSDLWVARCAAQISSVLDRLEAERAVMGTAFWLSDRIGHADIALTAMLRFLDEAHPGLIAARGHPRLRQDADRLEATEVFQRISQPFIPPS